MPTSCPHAQPAPFTPHPTPDPHHPPSTSPPHLTLRAHWVTVGCRTCSCAAAVQRCPGPRGWTWRGTRPLPPGPQRSPRPWLAAWVARAGQRSQGRLGSTGPCLRHYHPCPEHLGTLCSPGTLHLTGKGRKRGGFGEGMGVRGGIRRRRGTSTVQGVQPMQVRQQGADHHQLQEVD
jgi:hypothetical protein